MLYLNKGAIPTQRKEISIRLEALKSQQVYLKMI